jgi:hypothetical protein
VLVEREDVNAPRRLVDDEDGAEGHAPVLQIRSACVLELSVLLGMLLWVRGEPLEKLA